MPSERDQQILSEFDRLKDQYSSSAEVHRILGQQHHLSASRIRHILSDMKKQPAQKDPPIIPESTSEEFPDKKKFTRTYETVVTQIKTVQRYKNDINVSQDDGIWKPKVQYTDLPVAMSWMPDLHFGSLETDYDFFERHLGTIVDTPNMYVAFGGDLSDSYNVGKHPAGIWGDAVTPEDQLSALAEKLSDLDTRHKLTSIVWGNHDEFSSLSGINAFSTFFRNVSCPLFVDGGGVLNAHIGDQIYRLGLRHLFWGHSKLNLTNSPKRMIQFWRPDLDAAFTGHVHYASGEDFVFAGKQKIACVGGTYKLFDGFSKRWVGDPQPGGFTLLMYPNRKHMTLCRYPEDAADIILGKIARLGSFAAR